MVEMGWDGIHSPSEVHVVREVKLVDTLETHCDAQPKEELAPECVGLSVLLVLL